MAQMTPAHGTGLKVPSVVRFDKIATIERSVVAGKLGDAPGEWLSADRSTFLDVIGFAPPA
jgi:mRNA interferase MazF